MPIKLFIVTQVRDPGRKAGVEEQRAQPRPGPGMPSLCALLLVRLNALQH